MKSGYAAIILAAGFSSRMQQFKPLLAVGEETITDRVISIFLQNRIEVFLVVGWQKNEVRAGINNLNIMVVENPDYRQGMFTSIQAGLRHLNPGLEAFFIMPVDIPLVRPSTIKRLLNSAKEHPDKIIYPVFGKLRGHPPLIPSGMIPTIMQWKKPGGLKAILDLHEEIALEVKVPDSNVLLDIDTPEDYKILLERFQHYAVPSVEECEVILSDVCAVTPEVRRHCTQVSKVACAIGEALLQSGKNPDLEVIRAAAMLHDIAKGQMEHDSVGGQMLREMGFSKIGDIVAMHTDLPKGNIDLSLESKLVYLADKLVKGETLVSIEERFQSSNHLFGLIPEIASNISRRNSDALNIKHEIEHLLGSSLETVIYK